MITEKVKRKGKEKRRVSVKKESEKRGTNDERRGKDKMKKIMKRELRGRRVKEEENCGEE